MSTIGSGEKGHAERSDLRALAVASREDCREWVYDLSTREWDNGTETHYHAVRHAPRRWGSGEVADVFHEADARFIAAANPATVLALLDEVERLREALGEDHAHGAAERHLQEQRDANTALLAENDSLLLRNARLRAALHQITEAHDRCAQIVAEFDTTDRAATESEADANGREVSQ